MMPEDRFTLGFVSVASTAGAACLLANDYPLLCAVLWGVAVFAGHVAIRP